MKTTLLLTFFMSLSFIIKAQNGDFAVNLKKVNPMDSRETFPSASLEQADLSGIGINTYDKERMDIRKNSVSETNSNKTNNNSNINFKLLYSPDGMFVNQADLMPLLILTQALTRNE